MIFHIVYQYSIANFSHMSPDFIWDTGNNLCLIVGQTGDWSIHSPPYVLHTCQVALGGGGAESPKTKH